MLKNLKIMLIVSVISIICGGQLAEADTTWVRDANTSTLKPKVDADDNVNIREGDFDGNNVYVDDTLFTDNIKGTAAERLDSELVTNGTFTGNINGWGMDSSWGYSNNAASWDADYDEAEMWQSFDFKSGIKYRITFDVSNLDLTDGSEVNLQGGLTDTVILAITSNGSKSTDFTPTSDEDGIDFYGDSTGSGSTSDTVTIDNVSFKEIMTDSTVRDVTIDPNLFVTGDLQVNGGDIGITADTDLMQLSSGQLIINGNVGIGTSSPGGNQLEVDGGPIKATGGLIIEIRTWDPCDPCTGQIWLRTDL